MIRNIWRYSHFVLAAVSSLFILLATLTGLVLAVEPVETTLQPYVTAGADQLPLSQVLDTLDGQYDEILELQRDANGFVQLSIISMEEDLAGDFYVNPHNGQQMGELMERRPIYTFMTHLHRSLFLKTPGRIFVGVISGLLFLIALTGFLLFVQRQRGVRHIFDRIVKERSAHYYHVVTGRLMLLPVLLIAGTGVYLSMDRFSLIPEVSPDTTSLSEDEREAAERPWAAFPIFQETKLRELRSLEFPFSDDPADNFVLALRDRQLKVNQVTGQVVEESYYPFADRMHSWSFAAHTGTGSLAWSLVLALACLNIVYFIYSGAQISYQRLRHRSKNELPADEAEYIILVGSENGSTRSFGKLLQKALLDLDQKVWLGELNQYRAFQGMQHLVVLTSTYGMGDPPTNAARFMELLQKHRLPRSTQFSVVGFGSLSYPDFCQFALDADAGLRRQSTGRAVLDPFLIHNQSYTSFKTWAEDWSNQLGLGLQLPAQREKKTLKSHPLRVLDKRVRYDGHSDTFLLRLKTDFDDFQSGDLLGIIPPGSDLERWYSVARVGRGELVLSIRRHERGRCSNYLYALTTAEVIKGSFRRNPDFHFPAKANSVTLIANGTGIAPYLGMWKQPYDGELHLYWGGRAQQSYALYASEIEQARNDLALQSCSVALSRSGSQPTYVQDLLRRDATCIVRRLEQGGALMICGSIAMQQAVLAILDEICQTQSPHPLHYYQQQGQLLMDCY